MSSLEISELKLLKAEVERLSGHIKIFKDYGKTLDNIESALIGNSLNGHDGLVYKVDRIIHKVDEMEITQIKQASEWATAKWVFGILFIAFIGYVANKALSNEKNINKMQTEIDK